jgi:glutathione S-transferase
MTKPIVYGPSYSVYTRAVLMALIEKRVDFEQVHVDMDQEEHRMPQHLARHPFGMLPAFQHGDFMVYETVPILHYIDDAFPGPRLDPGDIRRRTRSAQIMSVVNSYGYRPMIWGVFVPRTYPRPGRIVEEGAIAEAAAQGERALRAIEDLMVDPDPFLVGRQISLADLLLEPVVHYFLTTTEGREIMTRCRRIAAWHEAIQSRPSVRQTVPAPAGQ